MPFINPPQSAGPLHRAGILWVLGNELCYFHLYAHVSYDGAHTCFAFCKTVVCRVQWSQWAWNCLGGGTIWLLSLRLVEFRAVVVVAFSSHAVIDGEG